MQSDRRWWTLTALVAPSLVVVLDAAVLPIALAPARVGVAASAAGIVAVAAAAPLVLAVLLPAGKALGARLGRRRALLLGLLALGSGSATAAWAGSALQLVTGRALVGAGAALILPTVALTVRQDFDAREQGRAVAVWGGATGTAAAVGPLAAGLLLDRAWWGAAFALELPLVGLALALVLAWVPPDHGPSRQSEQPSSRLRRPAPTAAVTAAVTAAAAAVLAGVTVAVALHLPAARGASPWQVAVTLLPAVLGAAAAGPRSPALVRRRGPRGACAVGLLLVLLSCAGLLLVTASTPATVVPVVLLALGAGVGHAAAPVAPAPASAVARSAGAVFGVLVLGRLAASGTTPGLHAAALAGVLVALLGLAAASRLPNRQPTLSG